eukprot:4576485-Pyramimonas_sp.AAC.1
MSKDWREAMQHPIVSARGAGLQRQEGARACFQTCVHPWKLEPKRSRGSWPVGSSTEGGQLQGSYGGPTPFWRTSHGYRGPIGEPHRGRQW